VKYCSCHRYLVVLLVLIVSAIAVHGHRCLVCTVLQHMRRGKELGQLIHGCACVFRLAGRRMAVEVKVSCTLQVHTSQQPVHIISSPFSTLLRLDQDNRANTDVECFALGLLCRDISLPNDLTSSPHSIVHHPAY
jgi:hypothetical protein